MKASCTLRCARWLPDPRTHGRVARSLRSDYSYFHEPLVCMRALACFRQISSPHQRWLLLLDRSSVIYWIPTAEIFSWTNPSTPSSPPVLLQTAAGQDKQRKSHQSALKESALFFRGYAGLWKGRGVLELRPRTSEDSHFRVFPVPLA